MTFEQVHSAGWVAHFVQVGYPDARPLAAGVEGAVYDLGDGTVAKVWAHRRRADLQLWRAFYDDLAAGGLPFATPEILRMSIPLDPSTPAGVLSAEHPTFARGAA